MTESHDPAGAATHAPQPTAADLPLISPVAAPSSPLVRFGGLLGILGSFVALLVLAAGCAGFDRALSGSVGAVGLGALGLAITLAGAFTQHRRIGEDTHVLQAIFACLLAVVGGLVEMALWMRWPIFK